MPRIPPPAAALAAALLQRAVADGGRPPAKGRTAAALAISTASFAMAGTSARRFRAANTTLEPFQPERAAMLVTSGPNAFSRNPMYLGMAGLLLAHAVWRGSVPALLPLAGFVVFIDRVQIQAEEAALREKFVSAYETYRSTTPRWIGRRSLDLVARRIRS